MTRAAVVDYYDFEVFHDVNGDLQVHVRHGASEENPDGIWTQAPVVNSKTGRNIGDGHQRTAPELYAANTITTFTDGTFSTGFGAVLRPTIETAILRIMQEQEL